VARGSVRSEARDGETQSVGEPAARKSTVLVIEDSAAHRAELRRALESSAEIGEITEAADGVAGLKALLSRAFDAVICDVELPGFDGEKLLAAKAQRPDLSDTPVLFVSANRDPARKARLLERGASDTIEKPFDAAELLARLGVHLRLRQLRDELREKNQQLEQLSTTDALTGLRNRRFAESFLSRGTRAPPRRRARGGARGSRPFQEGERRPRPRGRGRGAPARRSAARGTGA
jgi:two-component system cell cycle response regulator